MVKVVDINRILVLTLLITLSLVTNVNANNGIWISSFELETLPTSGASWNNMKAEADQSVCTPVLSNQDDNCNVRVMAQALVFAKLRQETYRTKVVSAITNIVNSGTYNGRSLALGRELGAYVLSADLIDLNTFNPTLDAQFRSKIRELLTTFTSGGPTNLEDCHEQRPNNWGTMCGGSRAAVAAYLGDNAKLARVAQVFKGYLGDRSSYSGFSYGDLSWQCNPSLPVGINPQGCIKEGHNIDGVMPDDQRRCGSFSWPPCNTGYAWEGQQGILAQAIILSKQGYDVWNWENRAILRAHSWKVNIGNNQAGGDDTWQPWVVNFYYNTNFLALSPSNPGKNIGWTDWTHQGVAQPPQTCTQQGGICCVSGNSCSGSSVLASDCSTTCCIGTCIPPDTTPPTVSITSPTNNQQVSGTITITATASDNVGVLGVQFKVDGNNIGSEDPSSPYSVPLNTATLSNGNHILTSVARDSQNTAASLPITINVQNAGDTTPPLITNVQAVSITSNSASITWTTNEPSDSRVEFGLTQSYGSQTTLNTNLVTSHSELITGLQSSTLYHYRVKSRDSSNNLATSIDFTFATIQSQPGIEQVTYNLQRGLNFITVPLELSNTDIIQVLSPILPEVDKVYSFYNGRWLIFRNRVNAPSSLSTIEPLRGYIVKMKNPRSFTLQGTIDNNRQLQLSSGWSLIGTNSLTSTPISTALQGLSYDSVWSYDTNTNTYIELNLGSGSLNSTKAYWAQLSNAGTFNP